MDNVKRAIFVDSTISHQQLSAYLSPSDLILPAIKRGDLYTLLCRHSCIERIIIIDGVFEQQMSISHKEIIWACSMGVNIVGIASMGALRASELQSYSMEGFGAIYNAYLNQEIDGDDEVAVAYRVDDSQCFKTIALYNLRVTLNKINYYQPSVIAILKNLYYKERTWDAISREIPVELFTLLKENHIDQKKQDVLNYFQTASSGNKIARSILPKFDSNIYSLKECVSYVCEGPLDFICRRLSAKPLAVTESYDPECSLAITRYLGIELHYEPLIENILNKLDFYTHRKNVLLEFSATIRKQQHLLTVKDFNDFLHRRQLHSSQLSTIFSDIKKVYDYFLANSGGSCF